MKLREVAALIVKPSGLWTQRVAEKELDIPQWKLSNFKNASDESDYEKAWQDFLKLLRFCQQRGIDPARELKPPTAEEVFKDVKGDDLSVGGHDKSGKAESKKKGARGFQTRRNEMPKRKTR